MRDWIKIFAILISLFMANSSCALAVSTLIDFNNYISPNNNDLVNNFNSPANLSLDFTEMSSGGISGGSIVPSQGYAYASYLNLIPNFTDDRLTFSSAFRYDSSLQTNLNSGNLIPSLIFFNICTTNPNGQDCVKPQITISNQGNGFFNLIPDSRDNDPDIYSASQAFSLINGNWYSFKFVIINSGNNPNLYSFFASLYSLGKNGTNPQLVKETTFTTPALDFINYPDFTFQIGANSADGLSAIDNIYYSYTTYLSSELIPDDLKSLTKDHIDISSGETLVSAQDFYFPTQGPGLKLSRQYRSMSNFNGMFGYNWHSVYDQNLTVDEDGNVFVYGENGNGKFFASNGDGTFQSSLRGNSTLVKNQDGTYVLLNKHGIKTIFNAQGRMTQIMDRNGNTLDFVFDPQDPNGSYIEDSTGRKILLKINSKGLVTQATNPGGNIIHYYYDSSGNLTSVTDALDNTVEYVYDNYHHIIQMTDADGHNTFYAYDTQGRACKSWHDEAAGSVNLDFQPNNTTVLTDSLNHSMTYVFNNMGLEASRIDPFGHTRTKIWDNNMNLLSATDENGQTTFFQYDTNDNLIKKTDALKQNIFYAYDPNFNLLQSVTDQAGKATHYDYDSNGNLIDIKDKLGNETRMGYDQYGNMTSFTDALNNTTTFFYNLYGQLVQKTNALGKNTLWDYDILGNKISMTDPAGNETTYTYDNLNRLNKTIFPDGTSIKYGYDARGHKTMETDQNNNITTYVYDADGRLSQTIDPLGGVVSRVYDTEGRQVRVTDADNHTTFFTYDALGHLLSETTPLGHTTSYSYDNAGNIVSKMDADGHLFNYSYDNLNRLTKIINPDQSQITYGYDVLNRRISITDAYGIITDVYDDMSRLISEKVPNGKNPVQYTYDAYGNRISLTNQDAEVTTYAYDALDRLITTQDGAGQTSYAYDDNSNLVKESYPNNSSSSYGYDSMNRVINLVNQNDQGLILSSTSNQYDNNGMVTRKTLVDGSSLEYTYDNKNQLIREIKTKSSVSGQPVIVYDYSYNYDLAGNRTLFKNSLTESQLYIEQWPILPLQTRSQLTLYGYGPDSNDHFFSCSLQKVFQYDGDNRLLSMEQDVEINGMLFPFETTTFSYDGNGNRTLRSQLTATDVYPRQIKYSYDFQNRLTQLGFSTTLVSFDTNKVSFNYDGDGRRIQALEGQYQTQFFYDGKNMILTRDPQGMTVDTSYTRGLYYGDRTGGIISRTQYPLQTQYFYYDPHGSVINLGSDNGIPAAAYDYDSFGQSTNLCSPRDNPYRYSTMEWIPYADLYYFRGRFYDPETGRWLTPEHMGTVGGMNKYIYNQNNPINKGII